MVQSPWGWGIEDAGGGAYNQPHRYQTPTPAQNNRVESNNIYHVMLAMDDGGGIYTLGNQPGTILRGNYIHDSRNLKSTLDHCSGVYLDEGSGFIEVTGNLVHGVCRTLSCNNLAQDRIATCKVHDNFFNVRPDGPRLVAGKLDKGLGCDEYESFQVPHAPRLDPPQLTLEAWIRLAENPSDNDTRRWIVNKNANELTQSHFALVIQGKKVGAYLNIGGCFAAWSPELLTLNAWHHIAMTYDGAVLTAYCDGKPVATQAVNRQRVPGNTPLAIGGRQDGTNFGDFRGVIDEVRMYDRALTPEEVKINCQALADNTARDNVVPLKDGLVGHWGFDTPWPVPKEVQRTAAEAGLERPYRDLLQQP